MQLIIGFFCACYVISLSVAAPPKNRVKFLVHIPQHVHKKTHTKTVYVHPPRISLPKLPHFHYYHTRDFHIHRDNYGKPVFPIIRRARVRLTKEQKDHLIARMLAQRIANMNKKPQRQPYYPTTPYGPSNNYIPSTNYNYNYNPSTNFYPSTEYTSAEYSAEYSSDYSPPTPYHDDSGVTIQHSIIKSKDPHAAFYIKSALENKYGPRPNPDAETIDLEELRQQSPDPENYDVGYTVGGGYQVNEYHPYEKKPNPYKGNDIEHEIKSTDSGGYTDPEKITEYISFIQKGYLDQDELKEFGSDHGDAVEDFKNGKFNDGDGYRGGEFHEADEHVNDGNFHDYENHHHY